jgi:hypothetical protein
VGEDVDKLKQHLPRLDYLRQHNWIARPPGRSSEFVGLCPLHADTRPSFYVNTRKNLLYCHGCGQGAIIRRWQMHSAVALRRELSVRGQQIAAATGSVHELTPGEMPSVISGAMITGGMEISIPPLTGISAPIHSGRGGCARSTRLPARPRQRSGGDGCTRLRQQLGRAADEYLLPQAHGCEPGLEFHAGDRAGAGASVWVQAGHSAAQRADRPYGNRYEAPGNSWSRRS